MEKATYQAYLDTKDTISVLLPETTLEKMNASFYLIDQATGEHFELSIKEIKEDTHYILRIQGFISFFSAYDVVINNEIKIPLMLGKVTQTEWFDQQFFAPAARLGMFYETDQTTFRIWAPTATLASVLLYGEHGKKYEMHPTLNGIWEVTITGNLDGTLYRYLVKNNHEEKETIDPYGVASTENGSYSAVVDLTKTPTVSQLQPGIKQETDAIIYEVSVRDFTIHESAPTAHKGQYLGLAEIDYLKDLGVTHIQLLPIYDFEGVDELAPTESYNWGYNPSQYNVPEGSYSTKPSDPYARINELKTLIRTLHEKGLYVVMDVVYNHVWETKTHPFNALVPKYYYRYDERGNQIEGSGCGNDVASERKMVRSYIVDSVRYWLNEYGIDGFRFDLMGLLDVETMNEIRKVCDAVSPSILLYGEGWHIPTGIPDEHRASMVNAHQLPRISHFNDLFRNTIKGSNFNHEEKGLVQGNSHAMATGKQVLAGVMSHFYDPVQSINYVECHDDHTLWDRLKLSSLDEDDEMLQKRHLLATAMTIFAQGIPFLHGGQEFFRTKKGIKNSYQESDAINAIDWDDMKKHQWAIELVGGYLEIRKAHGAFRFRRTPLVKKHLKITDYQGLVIEYRLEDVSAYGPYAEIYVFFNLSAHSYVMSKSFAGFHVIADAEASGLTPLREVVGEFVLAPLSTTIIIK